MDVNTESGANASPAAAANNNSNMFTTLNATLRKQSCGELVSRLKSRKILGLNCDCKTGETYRSKISQLLGNSETVASYATPLGLWQWYTCAVIGSNILAFGKNLWTPGDGADRQELALLYGVLAAIFVYFRHTPDRSLVRFLLTIILVTSIVRFYVTSTSEGRERGVYYSALSTLDCINSVVSSLYLMLSLFWCHGAGVGVTPSFTTNLFAMVLSTIDACFEWMSTALECLSSHSPNERQQSLSDESLTDAMNSQCTIDDGTQVSSRHSIVKPSFKCD